MSNRFVICYIFGCAFWPWNTACAQDHCVPISSDVFTVYFGIETALPDPCRPAVIPDCHTDIDIPLVASGWDFSISTDCPTKNTRVELAEGLFYRGPDDRFVWPGIPGFEFIGAEVGQTIWPFLQNENPSPGFASPAMTPADIGKLCEWNPQDPVHNAATARKWLRVELVDVRGPAGGYVAMWQEGASPVMFFSTYENGIDADDVYYIPAGNHAHLAWAFTLPGLYELDLRVGTVYKCDPALTADVDGDCRVTLADVKMISANWLIDDCQTLSWCDGADIDNSNNVNMFELTALAGQWLDCGYPDCE